MTTQSEIIGKFDIEQADIAAGSPGFLPLRFSKPSKTSLHAVRYATKYLIKLPEHGFPAVPDCIAIRSPQPSSISTRRVTLD